MRKYLSIMKLGWLDALEYRTEFFVSIFGWGIRLVIALFLWFAVAAARGGTIGNYSFSSIFSYFLIVQMISSFTFSRVGFDIAYDIYRGDFANFMLKPMNYLLFRLVHELSKNAFRTSMALLIFGTILAFGFGGFTFTWWKIPLSILAIFASYGLNFCLISIIALSSFWVTNATRFTFIYFGILTIFSGMILPIDLFPPSLLAISRFLPFQYIFFFPAHIIQTDTLDPAFMKGFGIAAGYLLAFALIVMYMYRRGVRHFEAVGR